MKQSKGRGPMPGVEGRRARASTGQKSEAGGSKRVRVKKAWHTPLTHMRFSNEGRREETYADGVKVCVQCTLVIREEEGGVDTVDQTGGGTMVMPEISFIQQGLAKNPTRNGCKAYQGSKVSGNDIQKCPLIGRAHIGFLRSGPLGGGGGLGLGGGAETGSAVGILQPSQQHSTREGELW